MSWKFWQHSQPDMTPRYAHVAMRLFNTPLMILPEKLTIIEQALGSRFGIMTVQPAAALEEERQQRRPYQVTNGVAIVNVFGTLIHRATGMEAFSGLTSYQQLGAELAAARDDAGVEEVLLWIDSPGGEANGVWDLMDQIAAVAKVKPVIALIDGMGASAAYAIASQATKVYATQGSTAGSIGVIASHVDQSKMDENIGVKVTHIVAGAQKANFSPHFPLSEGALGEIQKLVNDSYDLFVNKVSVGRGVTEEAVRNTEARLVTALEAQSLQLIDGIRTFHQLLTPSSEDEGLPTLEEAPIMTETPKVTVDFEQRDQVDKQIAAAVELAQQGERARIQEILSLAGVELPSLLTDLCFTKAVSAGDAAKQLLAAKWTAQKTKAAAFLNDAPTAVDAGAAPDEAAAMLDHAASAGKFVQQLREKNSSVRSLAR